MQDIAPPKAAESIFEALFDLDRYMPHGYCFLWQPELVWLHIISDVAIALAYFSIPFTILWLLSHRRQKMPYKWVFVMFSIFIFCCGSTHLVSLITMWYPIYYFEGILKVITAAASVATAVMMFPLIPALIQQFSQSELQDE